MVENDRSVRAGAGEAQAEEQGRKPVFYTYDEAMLLHMDHNFHDESSGKMRTGGAPNANEEKCEQEYASPEVPFRIKAIHDYLQD